MEPLNTLDYHRTLVYQMYDLYWNVMIARGLALGILEGGFGTYGQEYYDWTHLYNLWYFERISSLSNLEKMTLDHLEDETV